MTTIASGKPLGDMSRWKKKMFTITGPRRNKVQETIQAKHKEDQAKQNACDQGCDFHFIFLSTRAYDIKGRPAQFAMRANVDSPMRSVSWIPDRASVLRQFGQLLAEGLGAGEDFAALFGI